MRSTFGSQFGTNDAELRAQLSQLDLPTLRRVCDVRQAAVQLAEARLTRSYSAQLSVCEVAVSAAGRQARIFALGPRASVQHFGHLLDLLLEGDLQTLAAATSRAPRLAFYAPELEQALAVFLASEVHARIARLQAGGGNWLERARGALKGTVSDAYAERASRELSAALKRSTVGALVLAGMAAVVLSSAAVLLAAVLGYVYNHAPLTIFLFTAGPAVVPAELLARLLLRRRHVVAWPLKREMLAAYRVWLWFRIGSIGAAVLCAIPLLWLDGQLHLARLFRLYWPF